ncbi:unnamed protein product [Rotaria sp. Silwood2]|nr:unnamed protein product [Rotaria sp. Silwood2]CAF2844003.1 unnamed protein product [Rotaria sp. Silwood2]CAF3016104.1 unnamed protein product [Rotaria sp. Silwood2]CAF3979051.1 unnamed protein product [Rotaria sp. Silwood2]CAF4238968.1 unnamed protein product [Rotaria sp. Silwood2]
MPAQRTFYQRIFHHDLFLSPISHQQRYVLTRRNCSDRVCLLLSFLLLFYCGWYIFASSNRIFGYQRDPAEELAYKNAILTSSPILENKQICSIDEVDLVFLIVSSSSRFLERQSIRETWGSMSDMFDVHSQRLFVIGYQSGGNFYKDLVKEAAHEQDLLYLTVDDSSVTLKELHAYRWLQQHCSTVKYIFKAEDDLFVNSLLIHELIRELKTDPNNIQNRYLYNISLNSLFLAQTSSNENKFLFGWAYQPGRPERNLTISQYYVTYEEYPKELYPRYCSGFGYLMNSKTRDLLTMEGFKVKRPFRFSDIFITGILPENLNFFCEILPFTYHQGTTNECMKLIRQSNTINPLPSTPPLIICSTGRHIGQNSYSDYHRMWTTLKYIYADKLHHTANN